MRAAGKSQSSPTPSRQVSTELCFPCCSDVRLAWSNRCAQLVTGRPHPPTPAQIGCVVGSCTPQASFPLSPTHFSPPGVQQLNGIGEVWAQVATLWPPLLLLLLILEAKEVDAEPPGLHGIALGVPKFRLSRTLPSGVMRTLFTPAPPSPLDILWAGNRVGPGHLYLWARFWEAPRQLAWGAAFFSHLAIP